MAHGYLDVYTWAAAAEKAKSFDIDKVRKAAVSLDWHDYVMGKTKFATNQSLYQTAYVGELEPDGQFKILWQSEEADFPRALRSTGLSGQEVRDQVGNFEMELECRCMQ